MSELISGKEALIALANGEDVEWTHFSVGEWHEVPEKTAKLQYFLDGDSGWKFRLKPRTVNLNGVEVGRLYSCGWDIENPNRVTLEFNSEDDARYFNNNAFKIFNGI